MILYLVKMKNRSTSEEFCKIGITRDLGKRFRPIFTQEYRSSPLVDDIHDLSDPDLISNFNFPYRVFRLHTVTFRYDGEALMSEARIKSSVSPLRFKPMIDFSGSKEECFSFDENVISGIRQFMDAEAQQAERVEPDEAEYEATQITVLKQNPTLDDPIHLHRLTLKQIQQNAHDHEL